MELDNRPLWNSSPARTQKIAINVKKPSTQSIITVKENKIAINITLASKQQHGNNKWTPTIIDPIPSQINIITNNETSATEEIPTIKKIHYNRSIANPIPHAIDIDTIET